MIGRDLIGHTLGHYTILAPLGAGGMGVVYRARDERLGREVAIKLVPPDLLHDEQALKRFHQEARTLSSLSHANVAALFEFGLDQGVEFLVMELVSGASLRQKLAAGPLALKDVLSLGGQMAQGLGAAHEVGIVHRDLKPENLVVTSQGILKILDFGLAKFTPAAATKVAATASLVTDAGSAPGTLPYMAPEQLRGEPADARLDIYAAGAVLYEMATGRRPFEERGALLVEAILNREPVPASSVDPRVPLPVSDIICKALDKEPNRRYQSARELAIDLERFGTGATRRTGYHPVAGRLRHWNSILLPLAALAILIAGVWLGTRRNPPAPANAAISSIAVIPLANMSGDQQQEYFADGMTEELTSELAKIGALRVISRTSAMQYKNTRKTMPEIARELNVDAVIEGSVLRAENKVRITAQLINARADRHMWSESYERDLRDVLGLQHEVARAIAQQIEIKLTPQQDSRLGPARTVNPEAHDDYLRGLSHFNQQTHEGIDASIRDFQAAIAKDPSYAPAYAQLANSYGALATWYLPPREVMPKATEAAKKALQLDDNLAEAHVALGFVHYWYDWDWPAVDHEVKRALELEPNNVDAHELYAYYLISMGRDAEALAEIDRARDLDPNSPAFMADRVVLLTMARQYDQAVEYGRQISRLQPTVAPLRTNVAMAYGMGGHFSEAIAEAEAAHHLDESPLITSILAGIYAQAGKRPQAEQTLATLKEQLKTRYSCSYEVGMVYLFMGEKDVFFNWMQKAYDARSDCMVFLKIDPRLDPVRQDPRYQKLLRLANFTQ